MPMGLGSVQPVQTNTTLVKKKFPINEDNQDDENILDYFNELRELQDVQITKIEDNTELLDIKKLYKIYDVYDTIVDLLTELEEQVEKNDKLKITKLRIELNTQFTLLLLYINKIYKSTDNTEITYDKKDVDDYDMLVPSDKKDWLVNRPF